MPTDYNFVTVWKFKAPLEKVWSEINSPLAWPQWWKGVESVIDMQHGDELGVGSVKRLTWKSKLPYRLSFNSKVISVEPMKRIEGIAFGDLDGKGVWVFEGQNGSTTVNYYWTVKTTKPWMNLLAPIARPVFEWNHNVIMGWGKEGLAKRLNCEILN
jgi:uncharacterized protein YndB with AHSA1/START domain